MDLGSPDVQKEIEESKKTQTYVWTNFDIICPKMPRASFEQYVVYEYPTLSLLPLNLTWCKFPYSQIKGTYQKMARLWEEEMGDLVRMSDPISVYLMFTNLKSRSWIASDRWVATGCICIGDDETIEWCWMHPRLRNKGFFRSFMEYYQTHLNPLILAPPITKDMQRVLSSTGNKIFNSAEKLKKSYEIRRHYYERVFAENLSDLSDEEITQISSGLSTMEAFGARAGNNCARVSRKVAFRFFLKLIRAKRDPDFKSQLDGYLDSQNGSEIKEKTDQQVYDFINHGSHFL